MPLSTILERIQADVAILWASVIENGIAEDTTIEIMRLLVIMSAGIRTNPPENSPPVIDIPPEPTDCDSGAVQKILDVLERATKPIKRSAIAREAELSLRGSYFADAFCILRRDGRIFRPKENEPFYWISGRSLPEGE